MADVTFERVSKSFGSTSVLQDLDLHLPQGSLTVLVGPSGCGKSTTLRMLAGLESVSSGRILIGGRDVTAEEPKERDIAMVFQNYALYPHLTVAENIGFPLKARGMAKAEITEKVRETAGFTGIEELLTRRPGQLSGGQQQRVAIARAIVRTPSVFLFDEPLSNLDAQLRVEMRAEILRIHRAIGATTLYVTHDQEEAMTLSDQMVVMDRGHVEQVGPPQEIYNRPASTFVAEFAGSPRINLLTGEVNGGVLRTATGASVALPGAPDGHATVGIRPENLVLSASSPQPGSAETVGTAVVELVELTGPRLIITLLMGEHRLKAVADASGAYPHGAGATVQVGVAPGAFHLFDDSGRRRDLP